MAEYLGTGSLVIVAVAGDAVVQGVGLATGVQRKFSWSELGEAAVGSLAGPALDATGVFGALDIAGLGILSAVARGLLTGAVTQGIEVATGLQKKFSWTDVAAAGVTAGVSSAVGQWEGYNPDIAGTAKDTSENEWLGGVANSAGLIAGAATRTLINGSDFGDNILAVLPQVIGNTVGNAIMGRDSYQIQPVPIDASKPIQSDMQLELPTLPDMSAYASADSSDAATNMLYQIQGTYPDLQDMGLVNMTPVDGSSTNFELNATQTIVNEDGTITAIPFASKEGVSITTNGDPIVLATGIQDGNLYWAFGNLNTGQVSSLIPGGPVDGQETTVDVPEIGGQVTFAATQVEEAGLGGDIAALMHLAHNPYVEAGMTTLSGLTEMFSGGTLIAGTSETGIGGAVGAGVFVNGVNDTYHGYTQFRNAWNGQPGSGVNFLQSHLEKFLGPAYGNIVYQGQATFFNVAALAVPNKMVITDTELTGIQTTKSIFGVKVASIWNPYKIPGFGYMDPYDSAAIRLYGASVHGYRFGKAVVTAVGQDGTDGR